VKVLQAVAGWGMGGAERVALLLTQSLARDRVPVALAAAPGFLDAQLPAEVARYQVPDHGRSVVGTVVTAGRITRVMREFEPTLVHAHGAKVPGVVLAARRVLRRGSRPPVLVTFHAVAPRDLPMAGRILARADHVVCVSQSLRKRLIGAGVEPGRTSVIYNSVSPSGPVTAPGLRALERELSHGDAPVVCLVGRLVEQKRPELFVDMAAEIASHDDTVRFLVIGDGPLRHAMEARARHRSVRHAIDFTGQCDDARPLVAHARVMVFTSAWEGLSVAALEALDAGVPVVATETDGMRELLSSGAGVIVRDAAPAALAREVLDLLHDPQRRGRMARCGRELIARQFAPEAMIGAYRTLYSELLRARAGSGVDPSPRENQREREGERAHGRTKPGERTAG
jgi:glycosyltransferase involved in cell wall biosynthesis